MFSFIISTYLNILILNNMSQKFLKILLYLQHDNKEHFKAQNRSYLQWVLALLRPSKSLDVIALKVLRLLIKVSS